MTRPDLRALVVDDAEVDFLWLDRMLRRISGHRHVLDWVPRYADAMAALESDRHDLYFVDLRLGPDSGLDLIRHARLHGVLKPIIMLTGHGTEAVDLAATEAGANEYLVKGEFDEVLLERTIRYATRNAQAVAEMDRRLAESQATARELKLETERRAILEAELSQVLRRIVEDQEAERLRIARELHDSLGQTLTLLQLGLDGIRQASPTTDDLQQRVAALLKLVSDGGRSVNRLAWEIRPTALDDLGIQKAIRNLMETWSERSNVQFDLHLALEDRRLSAAIETTLYRVLQEALTNVTRHADAQRVGVILGVADQRVTMVIEDNGRGFGLGGVAPAGRLGLLGIRERVALVGGTLEIESACGKGTTLFVHIPLEKQRSGQCPGA